MQEQLLNRWDIPNDTIKHIENYFNDTKRALIGYKIQDIMRSSNHPDDHYLYHVIAKNKHTGKYAIWTCWNDLTLSLNFGHYDLDSLKEARDISNNFYNDITRQEIPEDELDEAFIDDIEDFAI